MSDGDRIESDDPTDPGAPTAYQARVLDEARALLDQEETEENWGGPVLIVAPPFIRPERLATFAPGGKNAGKLLWCALFASYCWWRAWPEFKPKYADSEVSDLWQKLGADGRTWVKSGAGDVTTIEGNAGNAVRERSYHQSEAQVYGYARPLPEGGVVRPGAPGPADLIFFVNLDRRGRQKIKPDGKPDFRHVGLVQRFIP